MGDLKVYNEDMIRESEETRHLWIKEAIVAPINNLYGTETQCRNYLIKQRWPNGLVCPKCGSTHACQLNDGVFQCYSFLLYHGDCPAIHDRICLSTRKAYECRS